MKKYILRFLSWIGFALKSLLKCRSKCEYTEHEHMHIPVGEDDVVIIIKGDENNANKTKQEE